MSGAAITVRRDMAPEILRYMQWLIEERDRELCLNRSPKRIARLEDEIAKYNGHTHEHFAPICGICGWDRRQEVTR